MYNSIVICGGGKLGFGILGGIQYMMDQKMLDVKYFSGTSIGSIICYFLAIGYTPIEMIVYIITNKVFETEHKGIESILNGEGLYDFSIFRNHFEKMTIDKIGYLPTLNDLHEKFQNVLFTTTYNVTQKKKEYISYMTHPDMSCIDAIQLSSSLPFIFTDSIYNEDYYIDGGFVDNCPFEPLLDFDKINPIVFNIEQKNNNEYKKIIDKFYTIITIPANELSRMQLLKCEYKTINIEMEPSKIYEFQINNSKKLELFSTGYNFTKKYFSEQI